VMKGLLDSFLACRSVLYRTVGRIVRPEEIEDIVQETFVLSYAASRNQKIRNPQAFMLRVARNIALDHIKSAGARLNCSIEGLDEEEFSTQADMVELRCQSQERFLNFCRAVEQLPVSCRRVFILKKVYGLSLQEISDYLGLSTSTVEKHVAKGMFMVLQYMLKRGYSAGKSAEVPGNYHPVEVKKP